MYALWWDVEGLPFPAGFSIVPGSPFLRTSFPTRWGGRSCIHSRDHRANQIERMGLLEYQSVTSWRDVAHDGVLCIHLVIDLQICPRPGQVVWSVRAGGMDRPSRTKLHTSCWVSFLQPAWGGPPCRASPLAFGLTGENKR